MNGVTMSLRHLTPLNAVLFILLALVITLLEAALRIDLNGYAWWRRASYKMLFMLFGALSLALLFRVQ
jgi:hypothetical protein